LKKEKFGGLWEKKKKKGFPDVLFSEGTKKKKLTLTFDKTKKKVLHPPKTQTGHNRKKKKVSPLTTSEKVDSTASLQRKSQEKKELYAEWGGNTCFLRKNPPTHSQLKQEKRGEVAISRR